MIMSGQSVHLTTLFSWDGLTEQLTSSSCTCVVQKYVHKELVNHLVKLAQEQSVVISGSAK